MLGTIFKEFLLVSFALTRNFLKFVVYGHDQANFLITGLSLHKKMKLSIRYLVTFTEEILNGKLDFFVECLNYSKLLYLL